MDVEPFVRMLTAALLAVPIGLDRELRGKAAGLRTHVVVATASGALGYVSVLAAPLSATGADGTRIAAQVVTGIGFIGAGVIFAAGGRVRGLTTAAALFAAAAVGLCVGLDQVMLAIALVTVTMLFLWPVDLLANVALGGIATEERTLLVIAPDLAGLAAVRQVLADEGAAAREVEVETFGSGVSAQFTIRLRRPQAQQLLARLQSLDGVSFVADQSFTAD
jgi:putative Mg2+ transporter-C (MgtC) family protein